MRLLVACICCTLLPSGLNERSKHFKFMISNYSLHAIAPVLKRRLLYVEVSPPNMQLVMQDANWYYLMKGKNNEMPKIICDRFLRGLWIFFCDGTSSG